MATKKELGNSVAHRFCDEYAQGKFESLTEWTPDMEDAYEAARELDFVRQQLIQKAEQIKRDMENAIDALMQPEWAERHTVNSLGILQSSGVSLDVLCGVFEQRKMNYERAIRRLKKSLNQN